MNIITGQWKMKLKSGEILGFYLSDDNTKNPLENNPEFDAGDCWSIDNSSVMGTKLLNHFQTDESDASFILIPKNLVASVYFQKFNS